MDDRAIIFLALSSQINNCLELLDQEDLDPENRGMLEYILQSSERLAIQYSEELDKPTTIPRPSW